MSDEFGFTSNQTLPTLQAAVDEIIESARRSGELRRSLEQGGVSATDAAQLADGSVGELRQRGEGFSPELLTLAVAFAGAAGGKIGGKLGDVAEGALRDVWTTLILPRLRARFGPDGARRDD